MRWTVYHRNGCIVYDSFPRVHGRRKVDLWSPFVPKLSSLRGFVGPTVPPSVRKRIVVQTAPSSFLRLGPTSHFAIFARHSLHTSKFRPTCILNSSVASFCSPVNTNNLFIESYSPNSIDLPTIRPRLLSRKSSRDVVASASINRKIATTVTAKAPPSSSGATRSQLQQSSGQATQSQPWIQSAYPARHKREKSQEWNKWASASRPSYPSAATTDVKGKGRAIDSDVESRLEDEVADVDVSAVEASEAGQFSNMSFVEPDAAAAIPDQRGSTSKLARSLTQQIQLEDRFDWRRTASQFRQLHLSDVAKPRRAPSFHAIKTSNTRSEELKSRIAAYQERMSYLVNLERDVEVAAWERLRSRSIEELVSEGWAIDGLMGYWQGGDGNRAAAQSASNRKKQQSSMANKPRTAVLTRTGLQKLGWTRLKEGDQVELTPSASTGKEVLDFLPREDAVLSSLSPAKRSSTSEATSEPEVRVLATVISSDAYRLRLHFSPPHSRVDLEGCPSWRIDLAFNDAIYYKIGGVIDDLATDPVGLEKKDIENKWQISGTDLAERLLPQVETQSAKPVSLADSIFAEDLRIKSWYERHLLSNPVAVEGDPELQLNESQLKAVATMLSSRLSLIQGPPGTGKTHTLVSTIKLLKHHFAVPHPILLSAHTNVAVDNLVEGALDAGLNVVRAGPPNVASKNQRVDNCSIEKKMEQHPLWKKLEEVNIRIGNAKRRMATIFENESGQKVDSHGNPDARYGTSHPAKLSDEVRAELTKLRRSIGRLAQQSYMLNRQIQTQVLYEADVVCTTLISSTSSPLKCIDFPIVFIDESTQALEYLSLMPLVKGARQIALIGDHKQLPPVLKSRDARKEGGAISLFERLISQDEASQSGETKTKMQMLQVQHRMHPDLAAFPNDQFYDDRLESANRTKDIPSIKHSFHAPANNDSETSHCPRLVFLDHEGQEFISRSTSEVSLLNSREVALLFHLLADLFKSNPSLSGSSIGIITPYLAQSRFISRILRPLREQDSSHPIRTATEKALGGSKLAELDKVEVNTVDGFQGREKDIIIFSSVRCSTKKHQRALAEDGAETRLGYNVGFLADERRLNVALTRAKQALFVVGHLDTWKNGRGLTHGDTGEDKPVAREALALRNFASHAEQQGLIVDEEMLLSKIDLGLNLVPPTSRQVEEQKEFSSSSAPTTSPEPSASLGFGQAFV